MRAFFCFTTSQWCSYQSVLTRSVIGQTALIGRGKSVACEVYARNTKRPGQPEPANQIQELIAKGEIIVGESGYLFWP